MCLLGTSGSVLLGFPHPCSHPYVVNCGRSSGLGCVRSKGQFNPCSSVMDNKWFIVVWVIPAWLLFLLDMKSNVNFLKDRFGK